LATFSACRQEPWPAQPGTKAKAKAGTQPNDRSRHNNPFISFIYVLMRNEKE